MGFNSFPFKRKQASAGVSEELYPKTKAYRDNIEASEINADKSKAFFDKDFQFQFNRMFSTSSNTLLGAIKYKNEKRIEDLTQEEILDIKNFVAHAAKRLSAGAIMSDIYHKKVQEGKTGDALHDLAPVRNIGHDAMHSMMAYAASNGESLVPAYTKLPDKDSLLFKDALANLEESYVIGFSELDEIAGLLKELKNSKGLEGEELVRATMEAWEEVQRRENFKTAYPAPEYLSEHRMPEFVTVVRNLLHNIELEHPDPKFAVHEFQRILRPLLERLRTSPIEGSSTS